MLSVQRLLVFGAYRGLPGVHGFHAGNDWEWYRPIDLDDIISVQEQLDWKRKRASLPATSSSSPAYLTTSINGVRRSPRLADGRSAPSAAPPGSGKSIPSSLTPILERRFSRFKTR